MFIKINKPEFYEIGSEERESFESAATDAFCDGDGFYSNPFEDGTPEWHGHEYGVRGKK